jgi:hypothetical protein
VSDTLRATDVPFMLTGSLAGSYHGAPRATQDIDLVIDAPVDNLIVVAEALRRAGLYVSDDAIREAVSTRGMFNAIDPESGWKVDFIMRKDRDFSRAEFAARSTIEFMGVSLGLAKAEDVVVAKLEWAKLGDSERQLRDVAEILSVQGDSLDLDQIATWVEQLKLEEQWMKARDLVDRPGESL